MVGPRGDPVRVDTDQFRPIHWSEARECVDWPDEGHIVLFLYNLDCAVKNYPLAARTVSERSIDAKLRVVSGVPYDESRIYVNASDALLVISERESGPIVVRVAAACNFPVVLTDVGTVADGLSGVQNSHIARTEVGLVDVLDAVLADGRRSNGRTTVDDLEVGETIFGSLA